MRVYISGKITGYDNYFERFAAAETLLLDRGYEVCNPADALSVLPADTKWEEYMGESLRFLCNSDAIFLLSNWKDSRGARLEHLVAMNLGLKIMQEGAL